MKQFTIILLTLLTPLLLGACQNLKPYQPDTQQGNVIEQAMLSKLKVGMTKAQVIKAMEGEAVLESNFTPNQMVYVYTFRPGKGKTTEKKLVLTFENDKLTSIAHKPDVTH
ncbi:MAG: outer membrane protein assembly factor BamE [Pseudomonadota bacterium]